MQIRIESPHFTVNEELQQFTIQKVNKLVYFNESLMWCEVLLTLDKSDTDKNKECEIKVHAPKEDLFASSVSDTFENAITETVHAIEKQIIKKKTRREGDSKVISME